MRLEAGTLVRRPMEEPSGGNGRRLIKAVALRTGWRTGRLARAWRLTSVQGGALGREVRLGAPLPPTPPVSLPPPRV